MSNSNFLGTNPNQKAKSNFLKLDMLEPCDNLMEFFTVSIIRDSSYSYGESWRLILIFFILWYEILKW